LNVEKLGLFLGKNEEITGAKIARKYLLLLQNLANKVA
jgi:hypothetical protein